MRIIQKTYFLLAIIIAAASINIFLLLTTARENESDSNAVISATDLKVMVERVNTLANSIARGNEADRQTLMDQLEGFEDTFDTLRNGGQLHGKPVAAVPDNLRVNYEKIGISWNSYKQHAQKIEVEPVFNLEVKNALAYVLEKNGELAVTTNKIVDELSELDRNYNKHKEIAMELEELAKSIGENTLRISIGEGENLRDEISKDRILFEANLRKLLQIPLTGLETGDLQIESDNLEPIPRENSAALRELDPLWEAIQLRLQTIESQPLLSKEFGSALNQLNNERSILLASTDDLVQAWRNLLDRKFSERALVVQGLLIADIGIFLMVIVSIRKSLNPLSALSIALSRVKEGIYGEQIKYGSKDEIGTLAETFNAMSMTIKEKEEDAKKIELAKDEFLAMITHELKTPLVPIQGYADILLGGHLGQLNKSQKERIEIIKSSSASLLSLISDLLDAQKLELGQLRITKREGNIKSTIEKTTESMTPQAFADKIELKHNVKGDIYAIYDVERITQVLANLIKNSLRAVQPKTGRVEIFAEDFPNEVKISVKDNGKGIPKEALDKIFRKFYQVDTSSTREKGGSGLGLSICKGIVETHGGKIWVESELGRGATFTFSIPKGNEAKSAI